MGEIRVHEFMALDGVIEDPRWTFEYGFDPRMGEAIGRVMGSCRAILLGRRTYELFGPVWSPRTAADDPGAPFMNGAHKYVVSTTLREASWGPATVIGGYSADAIRRLKAEVDGDLYVSGSGTLVRALLDDGLVDELHLFVFPLAVGTGMRLFAEGARQKRFTLMESDAYSNGALHLAYRTAGGA